MLVEPARKRLKYNTGSDKEEKERGGPKSEEMVVRVKKDVRAGTEIDINGGITTDMESPNCCWGQALTVHVRVRLMIEQGFV